MDSFNVYSQGLINFQKSSSHLQMLGARRVIRSELHNEDPKFWNDL
jgi:Leu/Phe-tRNA-protein transferase